MIEYRVVSCGHAWFVVLVGNWGLHEREEDQVWTGGLVRIRQS
jgi:hypothetical protein